MTDTPTENVVGAAMLVATAFRLRDEEALLLMLRRLIRAVDDYSERPAPDADLLAACKALLARDERNTCPHEETYRIASLWEICHQCRSKWADDEGGKPAWEDPPEWVAARAAIANAEQQS